MTKSEIEQKLHSMIRERLLGDGPWLQDDEGTRALAKLFLDEGLECEVDSGLHVTPLGCELRVNLLSACLGHHELFEVPYLLELEGVLSRKEVDALEGKCIDERGDARIEAELEVILKPVLAQIYREQFPALNPA